MGAPLTGRDLIEAVIEAEKLGATFYQCLAENTPRTKASDLFARIGQEEREHVQELESLLAAAQGHPPAESYPDEYHEYLQALVEGRVFPDEETCRQMARDVPDEAEACPLASSFEKQIILLLHEMRRLLPEDRHDTVQRLLEGEYEHLRHLHALEQEGQP